jgi:murein DD-endopeptidase MepM/ murein hydrolase activator NlpD
MALTVWPAPISITISQLFGVNATGNLPAWHPTIVEYGDYQHYGHDGIDIACWLDTPIVAAGSGVVVFAGDGRNMPDHIAIRWGFSTDPAAKWASGNIVLIDHGDGTGTYYAHLNRCDIATGQGIAAGTRIGLSGNTGRSGGPHLHFSLVLLPVNYSDPAGLYNRRDPLAYYSTPYVLPTGSGSVGAPDTATDDPFMLELIGSR